MKDNKFTEKNQFHNENNIKNKISSNFLQQINHKIENIIKKREILNLSLESNDNNFEEIKVSNILLKESSQASKKKMNFTLDLPQDDQLKEKILQNYRKIIQNNNAMLVIGNKVIFSIDFEEIQKKPELRSFLKNIDKYS